MARLNSFTRPKRKKFIKRLGETGNVSASASYAGISAACTYQHRKKDTDFALLWSAAEDLAADKLEEHCRARATKGFIRPVWYKGERVGSERTPSDALLMFMLRGSKPEKYRESVQAPPGHHKPTQVNVLVLARQVSLATRLLDNNPTQMPDLMSQEDQGIAGISHLEGETVSVVAGGVGPDAQLPWDTAVPGDRHDT